MRTPRRPRLLRHPVGRPVDHPFGNPFPRHPLAVAALVLLGAPQAGLALPQGAQVVAGQVSVGTPAAGRLGIVQTSPRAIVDWRSFGIGAGQSVSLTQPGGGVALFRVTGGEASSLLGSLNATGTLFLSNPGGVYFGPGARADVGSLVATTLGIANADFLAGRHAFAGSSRASVVNDGQIQAASGGSVVLLGAKVANHGRIDAPQGSVALGAGSAATLDVYDNGLLRLHLTAGADNAQVDHGGTITADGGTVRAVAQGAGSVLNIGGLIRAQSLEQRGGTIYLTGGAGSQLNLSGTLDASGTGGNGGRIDVRAERIDVAPTGVLRADAGANGHGGTVDAIATEAMSFAGRLSARGGALGGDGGNAEVSGYGSLAFTGGSDLSAPNGRFGTLLLDPGSVTIVDSDGNQNGPNQFADVRVAELLGTQDVTISTANATGGGLETITVNPTVDITWNAATQLSLVAGRNIVVNSGAVISSTSATTGRVAIDMTANSAGTAGGNFLGASIGEATLSAAGGSIRINSTGGNTGASNYGIVLTNSTLSTGAGSIELTGKGGASPDGGLNAGLFMQGITRLQAGSGNVTLIGTGGGAAPRNLNAGVGVPTIASVSVGSTSGRVSITGTGGLGSNAYGVYNGSDFSITAGRAIDITAIAGGSSSRSIFFETDPTGTRLTGTGGAPVTLTGDRMDLRSTTVRTTGTVTLTGSTIGRPITIGGTDNATTLGLTATELASVVQAGTLQIGSATSGSIEVAVPTSSANVGTLSLTSGLGIFVNAPISGSGRLLLTSATNIALGAQLSTTATNSGTTRAIWLRTTRGLFSNDVGANALLAPNGNWVVSLATPVDSSFGGLRSNNLAVWSQAPTATLDAAFTGNRYTFGIRPRIVIDAGAVSKDYGDPLAGSVALNNTPIPVPNNYGNVFTDYTVGVLNGSYSRTSAGLAVTANAGTYNDLTVTNVAGLTTNLAGYGIVAGAQGSVTVNPRPVTIGLNGLFLRTYGNQATTVQGAFVPTSGTLANGDAIVTALFDPNQVAATAQVDMYPITLTSALIRRNGVDVTPNYAMTFSPASLFVNPRPITVTLAPVSRVYGEDVLPTSNATVTSGTLVGTDRLVGVLVSSPATARSPVGTYRLQAVQPLLTVPPFNYVITYVPSDNGLTVTPRPLTLTPVAVSRPYGDGNPASTSATANGGFGVGLANGDTIASIDLRTDATAASGVGAYKTSGDKAVFASGSASNYLIGYADNPAGLVISPRALTVTPNATGRAYGDANPATVTATADNLVNGDTLASVELRTAATAASNAGTYTTTGDKAVFATGSDRNYDIRYADNLAGLVIRPRALTVTPDAVGRVYGDANPLTATASGDNLVNGDTLAGVTLGTAATVASHVGLYATRGSNARFSSGSAGNYTIAYADNATGLSVTPRPIQLQPDTVSRVYGEANPASTGASVVAGSLVNGDSISRVLLSTPATVASQVGPHPTSASDAVFGSGLASDYAIGYVGTAGGLLITPRPLTVTPLAVSRPYGEANPASAAATGDNLVNGDTLGSLTLSSTADALSPVGGYATSGSAATFTAGLASNYTIGYADNAAGLAVTPRALTVTPVAVSRTYGDANPATAAASGNNLVNGDTLGAVTLATAATAASSVGSYATRGSAATFTTGLASNYTIAYADNAAGLAVTPRALTVTPVAVSRPYGEANPATAAATGNNLVNGDTLGSLTLSSAADALSNVGTYATGGSAATFTTGLASNYTIAYADNATGLAVTPRALTVTPVAVSRTYGDANPATAAATGNNLVNGDTLGAVTLATAATAASNVGNYATGGSAATFTTGLASNYDIRYTANPTGLAVTPRPLVITPDPVDRPYGDANPARGSAGADNLVNGDTVSSVALASPAALASGIGRYGLTASDALFGSGSAANYAITYLANGTGLQVTPRAVAVTVPAGQGKLVGQPDPALGFTLSSGSLVAADAFSGSLARAPGEAPGRYPIGLGSLGLGPNYTIAFTGAPFTIDAGAALGWIDRTPATGTPATGAPAPALAALAPPAAGNATASECVRESVIDPGPAGASRLLNRGIRLPDGVVDACR